MFYDIDEFSLGEDEYEEQINFLKSAIKSNEEEIKKLMKQNEKIKKDFNDCTNGKQKPIESNCCDIKYEDSVEIQNIRKVDIRYYLEYLKCSYDIEDLKIFMPSIDDKNYEDVYASIMLFLQKELILQKKKLSSVSEKRELIEVQEKIEKITFMMNLVMDYKEMCFETDYDVSLFNDVAKMPFLVYSKTETGNIVLLKDLKKESSEFYDYFLCLFESLVNGNFKNLKVISNKYFPTSFNEVKFNQTRITFEMMGDNVCLITGAFVKKVMNSSIYRTRLISILKNAQASKKHILKNINNQTFIDEQLEITKQVYKLLRGDM